MEAVDGALRARGIRRMIHGHTHRPAIHEWMLDGQPARRAVLGDWYDPVSYTHLDVYKRQVAG